MRDHLTIAAETADADILAAAKALEKVAKHVEGKRLVKEMVVRGRLVVLVAK